MDSVLTVLLALYIAMTAVFILLDNRRPQATVAWMLLFLVVPAVGVLIYILFGRDRKAFSREFRLARQDPHAHLPPSLSALLSRQEQEIAAVAEAFPSARGLLGLVRWSGHSTLTTHNRIDILQDAAEKYPRLIEDLGAARHSIHLQYYIWASDPFTEKLKAVLIDRASAGVRIRLLYDPIGSLFKLKRRYVRELTEAGIKVEPYSRLYAIHTLTFRNHRKIAVIDGRIGYIGGLNIGQEHLDGGRDFDVWRDTHLRVVGEAATILQTVFAVDWFNATQEAIEDPAYFPPLPPDVAEVRLPVQIITSGPDSEWRAIRRQYFFMILAAKRRFWMQSPFFILDETIGEALKTAAMAGIDVRVMLSPRGEGSWTPYWAANTFISDIVEAGVRVFFYRKGYLHAKTASVDGEICSIGSANMDIRSFSINYEANAVIYSKAAAERLEADFRRDLADCTEFSLSTYEDTPTLIRLRDSAARLLSPLL